MSLGTSPRMSHISPKLFSGRKLPRLLDWVQERLFDFHFCWAIVMFSTSLDLISMAVTLCVLVYATKGHRN